jgi:hypothetical protein
MSIAAPTASVVAMMTMTVVRVSNVDMEAAAAKVETLRLRVAPTRGEKYNKSGRYGKQILLHRFGPYMIWGSAPVGGIRKRAAEPSLEATPAPWRAAA